MCGLCSEDQKEKDSARSEIRRISQDMDVLSKHYRDLGTGVVKPHSPNMKSMDFLARSIIRRLVEEWV